MDECRISNVSTEKVGFVTGGGVGIGFGCAKMMVVEAWAPVLYARRVSLVAFQES
jgi:NADP-dependent 3-hydroxy acid dehydrogenase YdfG